MQAAHQKLPTLLLILFIGLLLTAPSFNNAPDEPLRAKNGMVVSANELASHAGVEVMKLGGNAIDAAVATGFALAVTFPVAGNIGGGGFMVIRLADGTETTIDYREKAPAAAFRDMYLDENGDFVPNRSQLGYLASGVPGAVSGMIKAHQQYGKLPLADVLAPAIRLAEEGFVLTRLHARRFNAFYETFSEFSGTKRYFTTETGYTEGEKFIQQDLAEVLKRIRDYGHDGFYKGKTADLIVAEMSAGGGIITLEDLANYQAIEREPVTTTYRGYKVFSMPPPSSGSIALAQLLNSVEPYKIGEMGYSSSETIHLMGEAMRRVYADRSEWLGDPDFSHVPTKGLSAKEYSLGRMANFDPDHITPSDSIKFGDPTAYESTQTTHYSVVDKAGNAVSVTTTLNGAFGSKVVVNGGGFFLNNEMDDFSAKPGEPNMFGLVGNEANAIEPGKRMLSSMTPTIVEDPDGRLFMVIGTPGGATIITTVFQVILNVIDHGMDIQEAVAAPRIHHQWLPADVMFYERRGLPKDVTRNLESRGWTMRERGGYSGRADGIVIRYAGGNNSSTDPSGLSVLQEEAKETWLWGGADPRGEDTAVGY